MRLKPFTLIILSITLLSVGWFASHVIAHTSDESPSNSMVTPTGATPPQEPTQAAPPTEEPPSWDRPERASSALDGPAPAVVVAPNPALTEIVKMLVSGVEEGVLVKFIEASTQPFNVGSDEIVYLTDLGASGTVITAMLDRDKVIQSLPAQESTEPYPPAGSVVEVAAATEPDQTVTLDYFHQYLAPYGNWVDIPGYGLCWQPTAAVATRGWRPYADRGHWLYTDCGWYWYSDYSWGWAVFHYGRWFHHSRWGWCWVPGTVWGPSWVSWRYSSPYCGWAPLPPLSRSGFYFSAGFSWSIPSWCYIYIPSRNICSYSPRGYAVTHTRAREIHRHAKARDHYSISDRHRVVNRGIPPEDLGDNTSHHIRRAVIDEREGRPLPRRRGEQIDQEQKKLVVYRLPKSERSQSRINTTTKTYLNPRSGTAQDLTRRPEPLSEAINENRLPQTRRDGSSMSRTRTTTQETSRSISTTSRTLPTGPRATIQRSSNKPIMGQTTPSPRTYNPPTPTTQPTQPTGSQDQQNLRMNTAQQKNYRLPNNRTVNRQPDRSIALPQRSLPNSASKPTAPALNTSRWTPPAVRSVPTPRQPTAPVQSQPQWSRPAPSSSSSASSRPQINRRVAPPSSAPSFNRSAPVVRPTPQPPAAPQQPSRPSEPSRRLPQGRGR